MKSNDFGRKSIKQTPVGCGQVANGMVMEDFGPEID
jgi:hypothetical protein